MRILGALVVISFAVGTVLRSPLPVFVALAVAVCVGLVMTFRPTGYVPSVEHFTPPTGTPVIDLQPHYGMPKGLKGGPGTKTAEHGTPTVKVNGVAFGGAAGGSAGGLELAATPAVSVAGGLVGALRSAGLNTFLSTRGRVEIVIRDDRSSTRGQSTAIHHALVSPHALLGSLVSGATHGDRGANAWRVMSSKSDPTDPGRWTALISTGDTQVVLRVVDPVAFRAAVKGTPRTCTAIERDAGGSGLERNLTKQ